MPYIFGLGLECIYILSADCQKIRRDNHAVAIYKNPEISFTISRYDVPTSFGELLRKRRLENNLIAKELASAIGVTEDTILNWEKSRSHPPLEKILLLKETLNIDPSEFIDLDDSFTERQKAILNLIMEKGSITRSECQKMIGLRQQYAQNDLLFLFKLGVLGRRIGKRKMATYFMASQI